MTDTNQMTIDTYNVAVEKYIAGTPPIVDGHVKTFIDDFLSCLTPDSTILEVGSGFGRDASYMEAQGYAVERTDGSQGFVDYLRKQGWSAQTLNLLHDTIPAHYYTALFADAVLLHFNEAEISIALKNISQALKDGAVFGLTLKKGDGEAISTDKVDSERYFKYWTSATISEVLESHGFIGTKVTESSDDKWLCIITRKGKNS